MIRAYRPINAETTVNQHNAMGVTVGPSQGNNGVARGRMHVVATSRGAPYANAPMHREGDDPTWVKPSVVTARRSNMGADLANDAPTTQPADPSAKHQWLSLLIGIGGIGFAVYLLNAND